MSSGRWPRDLIRGADADCWEDLCATISAFERRLRADQRTADILWTIPSDVILLPFHYITLWYARFIPGALHR